MADITSPLSIWRSNGEFLANIPPDEGPLHIDTFHWLILEREYVIFSTLPDSLSIWTSKNPTEAPKKLKIEMTDKRETVLNSLLILVYNTGFKVIDYQKAAFLYKVDFGDHLDGNNNFNVYANQYYLEFVQQMEIEKQKVRKSKIRYAEEAASTSGNYEDEDEQTLVESTTTLLIYDFRRCT
uniref:Uncharacterized protein n=1 Tax=Homalodisca liturata TaxID=320908 RepID=A0A1B6HM91_9HEMI